jgi:hypothetical protein
MKRVWAGALGLVAFGFATLGSARAEGQQAPAQPEVVVAKERATTKTFYGWQILATGEVGSAVAAASVLLPESPLGSFVSSVGFVAGMPVFALGGPIVHWTHGDFTKGMVSFGGNTVFALVGGLAGQTIRCKGNQVVESNCGERGFFTGMSVAILIAPVLDAAILGWESIPVDDAANAPRHFAWRSARTGVELEPTWSLGPRGTFQLGVSGSF